MNQNPDKRSAARYWHQLFSEPMTDQQRRYLLAAGFRASRIKGWDKALAARWIAYVEETKDFSENSSE